MTADDITFAGWHCYYRDSHGIRSTLGLRVRSQEITLLTAAGDQLHFTPLETGLLLDALAAAIRSAGSVP